MANVQPHSSSKKPTLAELRADVLELREELARLGAHLADEVRTHRLVIDDHEGNERTTVDAHELRTRRLVVVDANGIERITTNCVARYTMLRLSVADDGDSIGVGYEAHPTVYLTAEIERPGALGHPPLARAEVQCATGDEASAILEQRTTVTGGPPACRTRTVIDEARVLLHQQRSEQCHTDHAMNTAAFSIIEVGPHGVVERAIGNEVLTFAPMQRAVRP